MSGLLQKRRVQKRKKVKLKRKELYILTVDIFFLACLSYITMVKESSYDENIKSFLNLPFGSRFPEIGMNKIALLS